MTIGIYVDNLEVPWMDGIYRLAEKTDVALFVNNYGKIDPASPISLFSSYYMWIFTGPIIACDMFSARYLIECITPGDKYYYINNTQDWRSFLAKDTIEATGKLKLITEPELKETVESIWGPTETVRDWNYEEIQRVLNRSTD